MEDTGYNGWTNYPTWCVNLWLSNDEGLYREALGIAASVVAEIEIDDNVINGIWSVEEASRFRTADRLKTWVTDDLAPDLGASFAADLFGYALGEVEWHEIADAWIEQVKEQAV